MDIANNNNQTSLKGFKPNLFHAFICPWDPMIYFLKVLEFKMAIIFAKKRHNTGFVRVLLEFIWCNL